MAMTGLLHALRPWGQHGLIGGQCALIVSTHAVCLPYVEKATLCHSMGVSMCAMFISRHAVF